MVKPAFRPIELSNEQVDAITEEYKILDKVRVKVLRKNGISHGLIINKVDLGEYVKGGGTQEVFVGELQKLRHSLESEDAIAMAKKFSETPEQDFEFPDKFIDMVAEKVAAKILGDSERIVESIVSQMQGKSIDKSQLHVSEPKRHRNKDHLKFVASLGCLVCGRKPAHAHHLSYLQPRALQRKTMTAAG